MNRIILIGNGFDLAHGLETKYEHFIDSFWREKINEYRDKKYWDENKMVELDYLTTKNSFNNKILLKDVNSYRNFVDYLSAERLKIKFKNKFLEIITKKNYPINGSSTLKNWVDIEEEYYQQIKDIVLNKSEYYSDEDGKTAIGKLNKDFKEIKHELENYLSIEQQQEIAINKNLRSKIYSKFRLKDISNASRESFIQTIDKEINSIRREYDQMNVDADQKIYHSTKTSSNASKYCKIYKDCSFDIEKLLSFVNYDSNRFLDLINQEEIPDFFMVPKNILFLNFNYTDTENHYVEKSPIIKVIHIHGEIEKEDNPIIFGYGDEQDETHKEIEKRGGDYLNNVKTINYQKTPNYKNLSNFIESGMYQVFIMGHSCGLSDKTLLNTLFEHPNCISIKPFYYIDNKGHNDYDDRIKNIYRCFTNKALMREKVVNLEYCEELI